MSTAALTKQTATVSLEKFIKACPPKGEFFSNNGHLNIYFTGSLNNLRACFHDSGLPDGVFKRDDALRAMVLPPVADYRYSDNLTPILPLTDSITFSAEPFFELLEFAAYGDVRYYLNSVLATPEHGGKLVATNGHIMRMVSMPQAAKLAAPVIVPRELLELALKCKAETLEIQAEKGMTGAVSFMAGQVYAQCRGMDSRYPDYMRVIPAMESLPHAVELPSAKQAGTWRKVAKLLGGKWCAIGIDGGNFVSRNADHCVAHSPAASVDTAIHFISDYFVLACKVANGQPLRFDEFGGKAAIFDSESVSVFMPCRV